MKTELDGLGNKVGSTSVAEQINAAIANLTTVQILIWEATD